MWLPPSTSKGKEAEKPQEPPRPRAAGIPDVLGHSQDPEEREMCLAWGKIRDQPALIFFDQGASDNFISEDLAIRLGIKVEELGPWMLIKCSMETLCQLPHSLES